VARVFFALLPDPSSLLRLRRIQQTLPQSTAWRLVAPSSMHLTLAFLGERSGGEVQALLEAATSSMTLEPMAQRSTGWLWLPAVDRPRVLAVGVAADTALESLAERVFHALDEVGWARPERSLLPHVTLARLRGRAACRTLESPPKVALRWGALGLFESSLTPAGPCYQPLWSVTSGPSSGPTRTGVETASFCRTREPGIRRPDISTSLQPGSSASSSLQLRTR